MFDNYIMLLGYKYHGTGFPIGDKYPKGDKLSKSPNIKGYVIASVPSRTFKDVTHSVVVNLKGKVVHDPNPNKAWQGINVLKTKELVCWNMVSKMTKKDPKF